jgi:hypothetical protein
MASALPADYLVIGAGAAGMAFADALLEHADVRVAMIDRRHGAGGHWLDDYPFVRLHQASAFYGVASTLLGGGRVQSDGPEKGLHERATAAEVCAYYTHVLERLSASGKLTFYPSCEYLGDRRFASRLSERSTRRARRAASSTRAISRPRSLRRRRLRSLSPRERGSFRSTIWSSCPIRPGNS